MIYIFEKQCDSGRLSKEIRESDISIVLDGVSLIGETTQVEFRAELPEEEVTLLNNLIDSHINTPLLTAEPQEVVVLEPKDSNGVPIIKMSPFSDAMGFRFRGVSFGCTVAQNETKHCDYHLTEERWINGGRLIVPNKGPSDKVSFQVIDKDNVMGFGNNVVLDQFITDFYIPQTGDLTVNLAYPARILAGLYLRLIYTSTHESGADVKCNLYLHWKAS
jgi:hypothetical protein